MQQATELATQKFIGLLPEGVDAVTSEALINRGFPEFLVMQLKKELLRNFEQSLNLRENKWLHYNTKADAAWNNFTGKVSDNLHLPLSYAGSIVRKAVGEVLQLLVEPRACLTEFLFLTDYELDYDEVIRRCEALTVYRHFGRALPRFMEKKELKEITKEECAYFIKALDEKLVARYTASDWEQLFQPWIALLGPSIDPVLVQHFFGDKDEKEIADRFGARQSHLSPDEIINIIGGKESSEYRTGPAVTQHEPEAKPIRQADEISEETIAGAIKDTQDYEGISIVERSQQTETDDNNTIASGNFRENDINKKFDALFSRFQKPDDDDNESDAVPMWKRYTSDVEDEVEEDLSGYEPERLEEGRAADEPQKEDEPENLSITDLYAEDNTSENKADNRNEGTDILKYVDANKEYFTDNLFGGDEDVYHEVLEGIQRCADWNEAIRYLTEDVYRQNFIDIYSEPAVDFTDAMQSYFMDKKL